MAIMKRCRLKVNQVRHWTVRAHTSPAVQVENGNTYNVISNGFSENQIIKNNSTSFITGTGDISIDYFHQPTTHI